MGALVAERAGLLGPLRFDEVVELALYHPELGFYERGGGAGRAGGDFLTSPELGPLFGAVVARALDRWWVELGRPDPFTVVEAGAGAGTLAAAVSGAAPSCAAALRYLAVERASALRRRHPVGVETAAGLPPGPLDVVLANELLDNLPFRLVQREAGGWAEVFVDADLAEVLVPVPPEAAAEADALAPGATPGDRIPLQHQARSWLAGALGSVRRGRAVVVDYADATSSMARRPWTSWVRTYRSHGRGLGHPLDDLGSADITCEVAVDQLASVRPPDCDRSQAEFLREHGLDDLVAAARAAWQERAHVGDLEALAARSRLAEAAALADPAGLGAFRVLEWVQEPSAADLPPPG